MVCCALHYFLQQESTHTAYISLECVDGENFDDWTPRPGLRTNPELIYELERQMCSSNACNVAKESMNKFMIYFNNED